ncbi:helix-turn-helix domain-containing protein [Terracoccus luteus]|uniref:Transcriptional regulator with XRE-family HTH domain n=1 Tax=Terracoccus luteus TaxID=53356 RepID=A0A839PZ56_9MICO|nr:helix-turn-helix domain-containing protein [Terracoccus luteus]MBB2987305.1 transcriptional regulator with XRE-family HTH domain [Terracoccus luteus]MCP2172956.1 transcriptional regulator with XRE-family HTH domain [Terracoccus luteus]
MVPEPPATGGDVDATLAAVGPRLRQVRQERGVTLAELSEATGISVSTLSRLESGQRRATLQLLLPLAQAHRVPLDDLVGAPATGDPRVHLRPVRRQGMTQVPLTQMPGPLQAHKLILPPARLRGEPTPQTHEGFEWLYVLAGRLRLVLGEHDVVMGSGEVAEFDTRVPHWFGAADDHGAECLVLFGKQGERMHLTASTGRAGAAETT